MAFQRTDDRKEYPSQCTVCGGSIVERRITLSLPTKEGTTRLVRDVPVGVCDQCGEQYLRAGVAQRLDEILESPPDSSETVPVWEFAAGL